MSDKSFKVKSGLQIPGVTSANILTTDVDGNVSSSATLPITSGGTGQTSANNALNALLPIQNGSTINYALESDGTNTSWQKLYNQTIKNNGTTVTPRGIVNIVGGTFADSSLDDTTTLTIPTGVSIDGGSTITASTASTKGLILKSAASQTASLQEWQTSAGTVISSINSSGHFSTVRAYLSEANVGPDYTTGTQGYLKLGTYSTTKPQLTIRAIASQTANLTEWQDSSGTLLSYVTSSGSLRAPFLADINGNGAFIQMNSGSAVLVNTRTASIVGMIVRGQTSQTANLQEWQNVGGTVLSHVRTDGTIATPYLDNPAASGAYVQLNAGTGIDIVSRVTGQATLRIRGIASQTADLQRWQDNTGTILASISASGNLMVQDLTVNGTTTTINSTTLTVDDKNIELASVSSPTDTTANGAGITIKGTTDKTFNWVQSTAAFTSSEPISAPAFKSAGTAVSSNITLVSGYRYFVDTTAARTLTLPAAPSVGDEIQIYDASNSALTNNITVASNSNKIQGSVQDLVIDSNAATVYLTYTGSTYGWAVN